VHVKGKAVVSVRWAAGQKKAGLADDNIQPGPFPRPIERRVLTIHRQAELQGRRFARRLGPTCRPMFDQRQQFAYPKWLREVPVASAREYLHLVSGHGKRSNRNDRNRVRLIIIFEPTSRFHSGNIR